MAKPTVLLLGTGHWGNPGLDYVNVQYDDMLAPGRQRQIAECVERLKSFRPTKVAIEVAVDQADALNEDYRRYRTGDFALTANERHQLGFRLAAELDHDRLYAIDWYDRERAIGWDEAITFARNHGQTDLIGVFAQSEQDVQRMNDEASASARSMSTREMLLDVNRPENLRTNHGVYADLALVGDVNQYVGADVVLGWYERNLKIFVNIFRNTDAADDRILVIIGAGHVPLLTHFVEGSGRYTLETVESYLGGESSSPSR